MDGTCLLIRNSNQSKCGSLLHRLASQFSIKNNQYPKNIVNASDILSNHLNMITGQTKETVSRRRAVITPKRRKETIHLHHDQQEDKLCTRWQRSDLLLLCGIRRGTSFLNVLTRQQSRRNTALFARPG